MSIYPIILEKYFSLSLIDSGLTHIIWKILSAYLIFASNYILPYLEMEPTLIIFWIIVSFAICIVRCYGLLNNEDNLTGKNKSEKRRNFLLYFTKIWFSTLPVLFFFWLFFYKSDRLLLFTGIDLAGHKVLKSILILIIGIPVTLYSGYLGNKLWLYLCNKFIKDVDIIKFKFREKEVDL